MFHCPSHATSNKGIRIPSNTLLLPGQNNLSSVVVVSLTNIQSIWGNRTWHFKRKEQRRWHWRRLGVGTRVVWILSIVCRCECKLVRKYPKQQTTIFDIICVGCIKCARLPRYELCILWNRIWTTNAQLHLHRLSNWSWLDGVDCFGIK